MRVITVVKIMALLALLAGTSAAGIQYVAVVESDIDEASGASEKVSRADIRLVTAEIRREAVKNLPPKKYVIMTSETVIAQGGAVLEECAEENCVITLGSKIGADFIVRGTVSKLESRFTLQVEMYETNDGTLVASCEPIRSESIRELIENTAVACADMFKTFVETQNSLQKPQVAVTDTASQQPEPKPDPVPELKPKPKEKSPIKLSAGGGAFFANDFGGGLKWDNGEQVAMPYLGGGAYLFFDAIYAELFTGFAVVGGKWDNTDLKTSVPPDMQRSYINIGAFAKYPLAIGKVKMFPLLGLDYEISISAKLNAAGFDEYRFDGKDGNYSASSLNALWFKFGGGIDADLGQKLYLRAELLYGLRRANEFENNEANSDPNDAQAGTTDGLTLKIGAGIKL